MSGFYGKMELILGTKIIDTAVQVANLVVFVGSCSKVAVLWLVHICGLSKFEGRS